MEVTIQKKDAMIVAGVDACGISPAECVQVWDKLFALANHAKLSQLGTGISVGVCHDMSEANRLNYMAGYLVDDIAMARQMGLDILEIPAAEYAVIQLQGEIPESIQAGWRYFMEEYAPEHGYVHSGAPDLEYYYEGDMHHPDYDMELWVPVVPA